MSNGTPGLTGRDLGPFHVESLLGAGAMGEVYRAHDRRLGRAVALKIISGPHPADEDRISRFKREARLLAALNHTHIGAIYGVEESEGVRALVLELVEGETLAELIRRGPLPLTAALEISAQIADALDAAHQKGIIHRDLKPANIKITRDGIVKVLDFGLAKVILPEQVAPERSDSSTVTATGTLIGTILGTAAYMSPEQARGEPLDQRTDLWAFGAVLYEMLTGRRAFAGNGVSDTLAHVLRDEPDWNALPRETPDSVRTLLRRCLAKDRKRRLDSAAAARLEIEDALDPPLMPGATVRAPAAQRTVQLRLAGLVAGLILAGIAAWLMTRPSPPRLPTSRFAIVPSSEQSLAVSGSFRDFALSPDGRQLVYRSQLATAGGPLILRSMEEIRSRRLEGVTNARDPFFSSDSRSVAYFDTAEIKRVSLDGGPAIVICRFDTRQPAGASWGDDESIVFATADPATGLWRVPAAGGDPVALTTPDAQQGEGDHWFPSILPGGRGVLYTIGATGSGDSRIAVVDTRRGVSKTLLRGASHPEYVRSGHLIYVAGQALHAVRFDLQRLEIVGDSVRVIDSLSVSGAGRGNYAVSATGTLGYVTAGTTGVVAPRTLTWVDRAGREEAIGAPARAYIAPRLSPDRTRIVVDIRDQSGAGSIWTWDLVRHTLTRIAAGNAPSWTPDGTRLIIQAPPNRGTIYWLPANGIGTIERLTTTDLTHVPTSVTPDGGYVVAYQVSPQTSRDVYRLRLPLPLGSSQAKPGPIELLIDGPADETNGEVSPDGHYIAYQSTESGRQEVYVRPFPAAAAGRWQVSRNGGTRPAWARTGRELFYIDADGAMVAVPVSISPSGLTLGAPTSLFKTRYALPVGLRTYDVSPAGDRFLMLKQDGDSTATPATLLVVLNWFEELSALFDER